MEDEYFGKATYGDSMREYARNAGSDRPKNPWILTPWDTWERNPYYSGPEAPHPENPEFDSNQDNDNDQ